MQKSLFAIVTLSVAIVTVAMSVPAAAQTGCYSKRCQMYHECPKNCK
jgi:hypothetical protein